MKIKKLLVGAFVGFTMTLTNAHAVLGLIDIEAGAGVSMFGGTGSVTGTYSGATATGTLDFPATMDNLYLHAKIDHFLPIIPNARVDILQHHLSGTANANVSFNVFGQTIELLNTSGAVDTTYLQTDYLAYWGIPFLKLLSLGMVDLNFGLNLKTITSGDLFIPIPMYEVDALVDLPFLPEVTATYKSLFGIVNDLNANVYIELPLPLPLVAFGVEAGYRYQNVDSSAINSADNAWLKGLSGIFIDWSKVPTTAINFNGFYAGLVGRF